MGGLDNSYDKDTDGKSDNVASIVRNKFVEDVLDDVLPKPEFKNDSKGDGKHSANGLDQSVDTAVSALAFVPNGKYDTDSGLFKTAMKYAGDDAKETADMFLDGVGTIEKNGSRIEMDRDKTLKFDINQNVVDGMVSVKSLNLGSTGFDLERNGDVTEMKNIDGVSVSLKAGGKNMDVDVKKLTLSHDDKGNPVLTAQIENPLPDATRKIFGLNDTISIPVSLGADGQSPTMKPSQVIDSVASAAPDRSILGLPTASDVIGTAADASRYVEDHPEYVRAGKKAVDRGADAVKTIAKYTPNPLEVPSLFG